VKYKKLDLIEFLPPRDAPATRQPAQRQRVPRSVPVAAPSVADCHQCVQDMHYVTVCHRVCCRLLFGQVRGGLRLINYINTIPPFHVDWPSGFQAAAPQCTSTHTSSNTSASTHAFPSVSQKVSSNTYLRPKPPVVHRSPMLILFLGPRSQPGHTDTQCSSKPIQSND